MSSREVNSKGVEKLLILHDNHFSISEDHAEFRTTTFHLFLQGFNGRAHLTSPSLDWDGRMDKINIDSVVVRPRRGYGRASDFYRSFFRNSFFALQDMFRILKDYDAIVIAGPCCSAPYAHFAAWMLHKPVIGYVIGDNRQVVANSDEYSGIRKYFARMVAAWEWAAMARIAKRHKTVALGEDIARQLGKYQHNVSLGFTSLIRESQIVTDKKFPLNVPPRLLSVGRLSQEKGIEWALRAVALLKRQKIEVRYVVVGDGPYRERLVSLAEALDVAEQVDFVGAKKFQDVDAIYATSDIFILPSYSEGVAKVLLEAMAARIPVIATDVGGNTWILGGGKRGYLVAVADAQGVADSILECIDDEAGRERRMEEATKFVQQNSISAAANKILEIVEQEIRLEKCCHE